jgi:RNA polymerase sigma factor (sigma-70 family)
MGAEAEPPPRHPRDEEVSDFYKGFRNQLRGYLIICGCPQDEADDIVQDSFLAVRERWEQVRSLDRPKAYLFKVAVRRFWRLQGKRAGRLYQGDPEDHLLDRPDPVDAFEIVASRNAAMALLGKLPPRQRQVLWLRLGVGFSEAETAGILSVKPGTVKSQLHDAKIRLAELAHDAHGGQWETVSGEPIRGNMGRKPNGKKSNGRNE